MLLDPTAYDPPFDDETNRLLRATIDFFESRGKAKLLADYHARAPYDDFLAFVAESGVFATFLTPARDGDGHPHKRWDTARIAAMSEILGFYGLNHWYPWQVTVLGLGPVWQSGNAGARRDAAAKLDGGGVAAFGLSEKAHGADIYATDMVLTRDGDGWRASGSKYYIGNGDRATTVSVFGRIDGVDGPDQYVFFTADATHPSYEVVRNVVPAQMYVAELRLHDYPVTEATILHRGQAAFDAALNTVNIGKFNLCFGGIGAASHAFHEAITHAHNRILYGAPVTAMPHIRRALVDAHARIAAMRLFSERAIDHFRCAHEGDRRYLLFNPVTKMKVTTEAEEVMRLLGDVVAARGFEADSFLPVARTDISGLPKLEGTVAVNLALILKFMPAYLAGDLDADPVPVRTDAADDEFLFRQGPARGLSTIRFPAWRPQFERFAHLPNVAAFTDQADSFAALVRDGGGHAADMDTALAVGEVFTLLVYAGLVLERAERSDRSAVDDDLLDTVFDALVRDLSTRAVDLHGKHGATPAQRAWATTALRAPVADAARFDRVWQRVAAISGTYEMKP